MILSLLIHIALFCCTTYQYGLFYQPTGEKTRQPFAANDFVEPIDYHEEKKILSDLNNYLYAQLPRELIKIIFEYYFSYFLKIYNKCLQYPYRYIISKIPSNAQEQIMFDSHHENNLFKLYPDHSLSIYLNTDNYTFYLVCKKNKIPPTAESFVEYNRCLLIYPIIKIKNHIKKMEDIKKISSFDIRFTIDKNYICIVSTIRHPRVNEDALFVIKIKKNWLTSQNQSSLNIAKKTVCIRPFIENNFHILKWFIMHKSYIVFIYQTKNSTCYLCKVNLKNNVPISISLNIHPLNKQLVFVHDLDTLFIKEKFPMSPHKAEIITHIHVISLLSGDKNEDKFIEYFSIDTIEIDDYKINNETSHRYYIPLLPMNIKKKASATIMLSLHPQYLHWPVSLLKKIKINAIYNNEGTDFGIQVS